MFEDDEYTDVEKDTKLTDWANEPKFTDLWKDKVEADSSHKTAVARVEGFRETFAGGKKLRVQKHRSDLRPLLARKNWEWKRSSLIAPFMDMEDMFKIKGRTAEDKEAAIQNELMINYYMATRVNKSKLIEDVVDAFGVDGTVFVKSGWNTETDIIEVEVEKPVYASPEQSMMMIQQAIAMGEMSEEQGQAMLLTGEPMQIGTETVIEEQERMTENHPTFEVCDINDLMVDPTCGSNLREAQFIIHPYDIDMNTLMRNKYEVDEEGNETGMYKNLDKIDFSKDNREYDEYSNVSEGKANKKAFVFSDKARKKIRVYEYWGYWDTDDDGITHPIVATWIGEVMVRLEKDPFPHGELPFSSSAYMPIRDELYGESDCMLLKENQDSVGKMLRAAHDITQTQAVGQMITGEQTFSASQWDAFKVGNTAKVRPGVDPKAAVHRVSVEPVPATVFDMINLHRRDAEELTGKSLSGSSKGEVATEIRGSMEATSKRDTNILNRLAEQLFKDMARKTLINMQEFASPEEVIRITSGEYVKIRREDLRGEVDLVVDVSTPEKDHDTGEKLMKLMQTNQANMDPGLQKIFYGDLLRLWKIPDAAKRVEEYEPPVDPMAEQLKQLQMQNAQLENAKLKMEIAKMAKDIEEADGRLEERESRSEENFVDIENKRAQALERSARADLLSEQADQLAQQFVDVDSGEKRRREIEDMQHNTDVKMHELDKKHDIEIIKGRMASENKKKEATGGNK